ncbi:MAG: hypothetical protein ABI778_08815, partial [Ignavibacteriota bacterium]
GWLTAPVSTKGSATFIYVDSTVKISGKDQHGYETGTLTYIGTADLTIGGKQLTCAKIQAVNALDYGQMDYTGFDTTIFWFSKENGFIARVEPASVAISPGANRNVFRPVSILLSYKLN